MDALSLCKVSGWKPVLDIQENPVTTFSLQTKKLLDAIVVKSGSLSIARCWIFFAKKMLLR